MIMDKLPTPEMQTKPKFSATVSEDSDEDNNE
jgi:hypothetical protein